MRKPVCAVLPCSCHPLPSKVYGAFDDGQNARKTKSGTEIKTAKDAKGEKKARRYRGDPAAEADDRREDGTVDER